MPMAPRRWCCFAPLPSRLSADGATVKNEGGTAIAQGAVAGVHEAKGHTQRGGVVVVKAKLVKDEHLDFKLTGTLATATEAGLAPEEQELSSNNHGSRRCSSQHAVPRPAGPSRTSTLSGINMLCIPPVPASGEPSHPNEPSPAPEHGQEGEEQDTVAPLPSSPSCVSGHHSHMHLLPPGQAAPPIISTFSINSQGVISPAGSITSAGDKASMGVPVAASMQHVPFGVGLLSPTSVQVGIARMRATAFDVLTGAVKTQDLAHAYRQAPPWAAASPSLPDLLHGGVAYPGVNSTGLPSPSAAGPSVAGALDVLLSHRSGQHSQAYASSPLSATGSNVGGSSPMTTPQGVGPPDLVQQTSAQPPQRLPSGGTPYCNPLQLPQYSSSPHVSQSTAASCASPGISVNSAAASAASPFGATSSMHTPSSKPPRAPTLSSAGTAVTPHSTEHAHTGTATPAAPGPGTQLGGTMVLPPMQAESSAGDVGLRGLLTTPSAPATTQPALPATYAQLHAPAPNMSPAARHMQLGSQPVDSSGTPPVQQYYQPPARQVHHASEGTPSPYYQPSRHHTHQAGVPGAATTSANPYGFLPLHNMSAQALSRALQGSAPLHGTSSSSRSMQQPSRSLMSNTSMSSQRRSSKPLQPVHQLVHHFDNLGGMPDGSGRGPGVSRGVPGRPFQAQVSKMGSASSRVALSGLLSRGSNISATSTDKGSINVDFRPRWR